MDNWTDPTGKSADKPHILVADPIAASGVDLLQQHGEIEVTVAPGLSPDALLDAIPYYDGLIEGGLTDVTVSYSGDVAALGIKPITAAVLHGILGHFLGPQVNPVNAPFLARERRIRVVERQQQEHDDYASLIEVEIGTDRQRGSIAGTLFGKGDAWMVQLDRFPIEAVPEGHMLVFSNQDIPGVIGRIGTILGNAQINIAGFRLGRLEPNGTAVCVVNVDSAIPLDILEAIRALPNLIYAKTVQV